jgi:uncharacterized cupredoxin-like copper-binding protein
MFGFSILLIGCTSTESDAVSPVALSLTAADLTFDANRFEVVTGQPVKLTLHNEGALEHDFSILEMPHTGEVVVEEMEGAMEHDMGSMDEMPEIHIAATSGKSGSIEFTPSKAGEYPFFCSVAGHKEAGMTGILVVTAP